ncbi:asparaginase [Kaistia terrae]|uniref:Asparaginase n=1 Tax=Kaistia terrae TaxID=537017 RepID=A0ABW0PWT5_9HYPH|nr:asparaginase [Kaistia terrae]MCX5579376.1 asparaginase [Kaistia terrae]
MPQITLITTGGTIASRLAADGRDVVASVSGADLRATLHDPLEGIEIAIDEFCNVGSYAIDLPLAFNLARRIAEHLANPACDGVVVTHGTDTMEESAWMADLLVTSDKPVVFTGAQRSADEPDTDGPRNIADAIRIAASPTARGLGVMIVFEQDFHAARDVTKTHASRVDTFRSGEHGKLGEVDGDRVLVHRKPLLRKAYAPGQVETDVELIKMVMGASDRAIRFAAASGAKAIVLEGFGRGNATPAVTRAVAELAETGIPVIVASRCPEGRVKPIYGNGGGKDLERAGVIFAGDLSGIKARILASVLLGLGLEREEIRAEFEVLGG